MPDGHMERKQFSAEDTIETILGYAMQILCSGGSQQELETLQMSTVSIVTFVHFCIHF
jgi:hypothetical protein